MAALSGPLGRNEAFLFHVFGGNAYLGTLLWMMARGGEKDVKCFQNLLYSQLCFLTSVCVFMCASELRRLSSEQICEGLVVTYCKVLLRLLPGFLRCWFSRHKQLYQWGV